MNDTSDFQEVWPSIFRSPSNPGNVIHELRMEERLG
jgi:hypothetical protein